MNCDICHRSHHPQKLPFFCPVDGRNRLYEGRIAHATSLIENESLERQINSVFESPKPSSTDDAATRAFRIGSMRSEEVRAADRTSQIIAQADKLRAEVEAARKDIEERRKKVAARKDDMAQISHGIIARRSRQLDDTERSVQMLKYKWNRSFESMAATRSFLSMEAARLYGLRRIKKSSKYELGGIEMIELPAMIRRYSPLFTFSGMLTASRCITGSHINLTCAYRPHPNTGFTLPSYPIASGNHASSSRLSEANRLLLGVFTPSWRDTVSRDCCDTSNRTAGP